MFVLWYVCKHVCVCIYVSINVSKSKKYCFDLIPVFISLSSLLK